MKLSILEIQADKKRIFSKFVIQRMFEMVDTLHRISSNLRGFNETIRKRR